MINRRSNIGLTIIAWISLLAVPAASKELKFSNSHITAQSGNDVFELIVWCYSTGQTGADQIPYDLNSPQKPLEFPCSELTKQPPKDGRGFYIPHIGPITPRDFQQAKLQVAEGLRSFVCDRFKVALLGGAASSPGSCPTGEQQLSAWLFMEVTSDAKMQFPTVEAVVYGRSEYLAIPREKYWERYRFFVQEVATSANEAKLVVSIDEAREEKNGDDLKLMPIKSPIGEEHRIDVERFFNRIADVLFAPGN